MKMDDFNDLFIFGKYKETKPKCQSKGLCYRLGAV